MHYTHMRAGVFDRQAAAAWTPAALPGIKLWCGSGSGYDFTDAGGTTPATNGQAIYTRKDSVGAGSLQQATAANRPLLDATGTPFADFDGANDLLSGSAAYAQPSAAGLCVVWVGTPGGDVVRLAQRSGFSEPQWFVTRQGTLNFGVYVGSGSLVQVAATAPSLGTRLIVIAQYDRANVTIQVNGGSTTTTAETRDWWFSSSAEAIALGSTLDGFNPYDGGQESLILCDPITAGDRTSLLAYYGF